MKNNKIKILFIISFLIYCCTSRNKDESYIRETDKGKAEEHNDTKFSNGPESDAQFLVDAATINFEEMELGNFAVVKGNNPAVRDLGKFLFDEHSNIQSELFKLAEAKTISIPHSAPVESLNNFSMLKEENNNNFDKLYSNFAAASHKEAIAMFEKAAKEVVDVDIKAWAMKMLPKLRTQLDHIMNCQTVLDSIK